MLICVCVAVNCECGNCIREVLVSEEGCCVWEAITFGGVCLWNRYGTMGVSSWGVSAGVGSMGAVGASPKAVRGGGGGGLDW